MKPTLKKYLNVFQYLQDVYLFRKKVDSRFSYDVWAEELNASDKSYVRLVVFGKRPLNPKMAAALVKNLELSEVDAEYFLMLIQYSQSKTREQKDLFGKKLISLLRNDFDYLEIQAHHEFLSHPLLPRLQVILSFQDLDQSVENLSWILGVSVQEVTEALEKLENFKLVEKVQGRYNPLKKSFKVPDGFGEMGLKLFYERNLDDARAAIQLPKEERRFKSLFLPMNEGEFQKYLDNLESYLNEQLVQHNPDDYVDRRLYQVHFNIIPVSAKTR